MIIREIKHNPEQELIDFDWFNDYKDTVKWCKKFYPEIVPKLNEGYKAWLKEQLEDFKKEERRKAWNESKFEAFENSSKLEGKEDAK